LRADIGADVGPSAVEDALEFAGVDRHASSSSFWVAARGVTTPESPDQARSVS
jgi:hypothetical protein